jgi:hypothetical protein
MRGWVTKAARTACSNMASECATAARHSGANDHAAAGVHGGTHRLPSNPTSADRDATRSMTISAGSADGGSGRSGSVWPSSPTVLPRPRLPDADGPLLLRARQASVPSSARHTPAQDEFRSP